VNIIFQYLIIYISILSIYSALMFLSWKCKINYMILCRYTGTPERCEGKRGRFSWKGTFELIFSKRCLQNIGSWTSPDHVFYLLDDRGVRGFSARRLCYSWSSMTAFLAFSEAIVKHSKLLSNIQTYGKVIRCRQSQRLLHACGTAVQLDYI
jgi:hypothetical protein